LVWIKPRQSASTKSHSFWDTIRGVGTYISSNLTNGNVSEANGLTAFSSNGFSVGINTGVNESTYPIVSWTFREQPKFFDIVTYTGTGANTTIAHNLGSIPGCIIVKRTDTTGAWQVYHRSLANTQYMVLNTTAAVATGATRWNSTTPTSSVFSLGTDTTVNASGGTYVAYLFAHNAGGFGLSGTENVISCGSYTGNGSTSGPVTTLGYEPQWILIKNASATTGGWVIVDNMRGLPVGGNSNVLRANVSGAESTSVGGLTVTATGFQQHDTDPNFNESGSLYIYIAIRRGPMQVPTLGTSVFSPNTFTGASIPVTTNFPVDGSLYREVDVIMSNGWFSRLQGIAYYLNTDSADVESLSLISQNYFASNTTFQASNDGNSRKRTYWNFKRAPGFFDAVCYIGTGSATTQSHNLGVVPEMIIVKNRGVASNWQVYHSAYGPTLTTQLNLTNATNSGTSVWNSTTPTASVFSIGTSQAVNGGANTYVAYLFATVAGVSKVGSYTGTAATLNIDAGFTTGARFVMIKRTDSTGDWWVWDTSRGMVAGTDPRLALNSNAAELNNNWVYTASSGFQIVTTDASVNASGGTYIYLAIA
jgi:hypothetical protein